MAPKQQRLGNYFRGSSQSRAGTKRQRAPSAKSSLSRTSFWKQQKGSSNDGGDSSRFGECPMCRARLPLHVLLAHAEECTGENPKRKTVDKVKNINNKTFNTTGTPYPSENINNERSSLLPIQSNQSRGPTPSVIDPWWKKNESECTLPHSSEPLPGLYLFEDFITEAEERQILQELDGASPEHRDEFLPWKSSNFNGPHFVKRWGVHCNLRDRRVHAPENPLPNFFQSILVEKLQTLKPMKGCVPNEANAIDYRQRSGHYLTNHVDDRQLSKEPIANLSIGGDCYMTFRNEKTNQGNKQEEKRVLLKRRTLQVLTGKARYDYSHGIKNCDLVSERRISVTMRESPLTKNKKIL